MIIKASNPDPSHQPVALDLADVPADPPSRGPSLRGEAARIIADAKRQAERLRREAVAQGRREGQRAAREESARRQDEQCATLVPTLNHLVDELRHARQDWLAHWEKTAVGLAVAIARRVLRRELAAHPEVSPELVREALELAAGNGRVRVLLSPADHRSLGPRLADLAGRLGELGPVEVSADEAISPGGCRVETRFGIIDQQFEAQLARIEEELT